MGAFSIVAASLAEGIGPGSDAPPLSIKKWLKGTPIKALDKNKTYVVEFWATWCGPCRESIPHLTELAKKNKDVTFIGVGIWEDDKDDVPQKFVDGMGDKMDYTVGYSGNKDGMAATWMAAAGQNGIPSAFVVKGGKIQWVGHPMEMDGPLAEIKAGKFDVAKFKAEFDKEAEKNRQAAAARKAITEATKLYDAGKREDAKVKLAEVEKAYPTVAGQLEQIRFEWLAQEDAAAWEAKAKEIAASKSEERIQALAMFAAQQVNKPNGDKAKAKVAIDLATTATQEKDLLILYYRGMVYMGCGDYAVAADAYEKALAVLPNSQYKDNAGLKQMLEKSRDDAKSKIKS